MSDIRGERRYLDRRVSYERASLVAEDLAPSPLAQFERWYREASDGQVLEPNAMVVATAAPDGAPSSRSVLLREVGPRGFTFFTNYGSRKAREIETGSGAVALLFPWYGLERQVVVRGVAERVPVEESRAYFGTRPWESRIGAWASHQSRPIADRAELDDRWAGFARRWPDRGRPDDVPLPPHWGGFVVRVADLEFWQGRRSRLHDRLAYVADPGPTASLDDATAWRLERRQP